MLARAATEVQQLARGLVNLGRTAFLSAVNGLNVGRGAIEMPCAPAIAASRTGPSSS